MRDDLPHPVPPESASRMLDRMVAASEMPYGYTNSPPPADTGDFDQARLEAKRYPLKGGKGL